jgi:type IV pilus assembly protein PilV
MNTLHRRARQRGIGMIEVLAALFIISVGVLSFAKTEGLALSETGIAARRSIAAFEADSLAAAMNANEAFWQKTLSGNVPFTVSITGASGGVTVSNPLFSSIIAADCSASSTPPTCSNQQMASYDVNSWAAQLSGLLKNYTATIQCNQSSASVPVTCTININWTEGAVASITNTSYLSNMNSTNINIFQPSYTVYVQP